MLRKHPKARTWIVGPLVLVFAGWFALVPGKGLVVSAYDVATIDGCRKGTLQAVDDYTVAMQHIPRGQDDAGMARDIATSEQLLTDRIGGLWCPSYVKDSQEAFVRANQAWVDYLRTIEHGAAFDWRTLYTVADSAGAAFADYNKALVVNPGETK